MSWEHAAEARAALNAIVTDPEHGVAALSSAQTMSNLLKDLLPDAPREKSLLVAAAEAGLASTLRQHVGQGMDPETAVRLTASSFSATTPFTPEACTWVTGEIASALGIVRDGGFGGNAPGFNPAGQQGMPTRILPIPGAGAGSGRPQSPPFGQPPQPGFGGGAAQETRPGQWPQPGQQPGQQAGQQPGQQAGQFGGFGQQAGQQAPSGQPAGGFGQQGQPGQPGGFGQQAPSGQPAGGFGQQGQPGQPGGFGQQAPSGQPGGGFGQQSPGGGFGQPGQPGAAFGQNQPGGPGYGAPPPGAWQGGPPAGPGGYGQPGSPGAFPAQPGSPGGWPPGGYGPVPGGPKPRGSRRGLLIGGGLVVVLIVVVVVATSLSGKGGNGGSGSSGGGSHSASVSASASPSLGNTSPAVAAPEPLSTIMNPPGATPVGTSCGTAKTFNLNPATITASTFCSKTTTANVTVWGYQFDNASDYQAGVADINHYVGFDKSTPGTGCPPPSGSTEGKIGWHAKHNPKYVARSGQDIECLIDGNEPVLIWTMPTQNVFFIGEDTVKGSSLQTVINWWETLVYG